MAYKIPPLRNQVGLLKVMTFSKWTRKFLFCKSVLTECFKTSRVLCSHARSVLSVSITCVHDMKYIHESDGKMLYSVEYLYSVSCHNHSDNDQCTYSIKQLKKKKLANIQNLKRKGKQAFPPFQF